MSKLRKRVINIDTSHLLPTEKELEDFEHAWQMLCAGKSVCVNDPSKSNETHKIMEEVKRGNFISIDYDGDLSYEEFFDRLMNGEYDEK